MERRLFDDLVVSRRRVPRSGGGMPVSFAVHAAGLAALLTLGALVPQDMPEVPVVLPPMGPIVSAAGPPLPAAPRRPRTIAPRRAPDPRRESVVIPETAPVPDSDPFDDADVDCLGCEPGDGQSGGHPDFDGLLDETALRAGQGGSEPSPPVERVRVGGRVEAPRKLRQVDPVYPELARRAGVTGIVILECVIDRGGRIGSVRVLKGHPLLDDAALDAVRQWTYRPTLLNGVAVEVVMTVTVRFSTAR